MREKIVFYLFVEHLLYLKKKRLKGITLCFGAQSK